MNSPRVQIIIAYSILSINLMNIIESIKPFRQKQYSQIERKLNRQKLFQLNRQFRTIKEQVSPSIPILQTHNKTTKIDEYMDINYKDIINIFKTAQYMPNQFNRLVRCLATDNIFAVYEGMIGIYLIKSVIKEKKLQVLNTGIIPYLAAQFNNQAHPFLRKMAVFLMNHIIQKDNSQLLIIYYNGHTVDFKLMLKMFNTMQLVFNNECLKLIKNSLFSGQMQVFKMQIIFVCNKLLCFWNGDNLLGAQVILHIMTKIRIQIDEASVKINKYYFHVVKTLLNLFTTRYKCGNEVNLILNILNRSSITCSLIKYIKTHSLQVFSQKYQKLLTIIIQVSEINNFISSKESFGAEELINKLLIIKNWKNLIKRLFDCFPIFELLLTSTKMMNNLWLNLQDFIFQGKMDLAKQICSILFTTLISCIKKGGAQILINFIDKDNFFQRVSKIADNNRIKAIGPVIGVIISLLQLQKRNNIRQELEKHQLIQITMKRLGNANKIERNTIFKHLSYTMKHIQTFNPELHSYVKGKMLIENSKNILSSIKKQIMIDPNNDSIKFMESIGI